MAQMTDHAEAKPRNRIGDWKGLLHDSARSTKLWVFCALLIVSTSMTFTQLGFIGIGRENDYLGYALGLLAPLAAVTLLLGKGPGALFGLTAGGVLFVHARIQPLDLFERYFTSVPNSFVLYALTGFLMGLFFAIALRNNPQGKRRVAYIAIVCLLTAILSSLMFLTNAFLSVVLSMAQTLESQGGSEAIEFSSEMIGAIESLGDISVQMLIDFALMFVVSLLSAYFVRSFKEKADSLSVRATFRTQLFVGTALVFCVVQAVSFVIITRSAEGAAKKRMDEELDYLCIQVQDTLDRYDAIAEVASHGTLSDEDVSMLTEKAGADDMLDGYDLDDGTIVVFDNDVVAYSYSPAFPKGAKLEDLFVALRLDSLEELAATGDMRDMLYDTRPHSLESEVSDFTSAQLGYMCVRKAHDVYIMIAMPASMVFANRTSTMRWVTVMALMLLLTIYLLAARLLSRDVVSPIDRTNASLAKITAGDLTETVKERDNVEFASLSDGINSTVDSLRGLIADAERRNAVELATAKAIQASALPRVFPPFPEIKRFDIFASMDAAKQVGGDFFDLFLVDDDTLGFLIADVSGKGIPGALFMMAAKTEIKNYLSTGMEPAQAIASANSRLCANNDAGMFVTVWAATLDWKSGLLTYVNAGHNPPLLRHGNGGSWEWLTERCGLFLGTFETAKYRQKTLTLAPGDELLLYTDGVNEAFNLAEEEYSNVRLERFVTQHNTMHPREIVRALRADVANWAAGAEQSDDVTILALEYGVAPEVTGTITVPATLEHLGDAIELVTGELERRLCPVDVMHKVEVALEELFVNVCNYAYAGQDEPGTVQVSYAYGTNPSAITVELRDTGTPFDPLRSKDPTMPTSIHDAQIGGLGIMMVRRSMDDFTYLRDNDSNVVVFKKGW